MGRPSVAHERIATILDATSRCIARHGVEGTTLEKVAAEAGLSRSHVRHYVGNRADLVDLFRARILDRYAPPDPAEAGAHGLAATAFALRFLFDEEADFDEYAAVDAILAAARHDEALRADVAAAYTRIEGFIAAVVAMDNPDWPDSRVAAVASQVLMLFYGHWTMSSIGLASTRLNAARNLAAELMGATGTVGPTAKVAGSS